MRKQKNVNPLISLVVPGYNEDANVESTVRQCVGALEELEVGFELILVNDGSNDETSVIIDKIVKSDHRIIGIHNPINLGVGSSILIGAQRARGEFVLFNSMDLPLDPKDISLAMPHLEDVDVVVFVRTNRASHTPWRKVTSWVHHWLVRVLFQISVRDMNFSQMYRREIICESGVRARSPAFVTPELIIRALDAGRKLIEIETKFHPRIRGVANFGKPRDILWTLGDIVGFWLERLNSKRMKL